MSRLTRDGTAEPVSRDQILRHARGQGNIIFPVQLTTSRIGNLTRLIHTLLYVMTIHTYIHAYCCTGYILCCSASARSLRGERCSNLYFWTSSHQYCNVLQQVCVPAPARFERNERKYTTGVLCDALRMFFLRACALINIWRACFFI